MSESETYYDFLKACTEKLPIKISNRQFTDYIIADCCKSYGKTKKLLEYTKWFDMLCGKEKLTTKQIETKFSEIGEIIKRNSELGATGKTYMINSERILKELFELLPNEDLPLPQILETQIKLFETLRYTNAQMDENMYYIINSRNEIKPNIITYQLKTGVIENKKVDKQAYDILFIQDGDIIKVNKMEDRHGFKITGKDENGINIVEPDETKRYSYFCSYDILYRDYKKSNKSLVEE